MAAVAAVLLVDPHGRLLLQERDEHAPVDAERWGMVGGQVEAGESPQAAAYRELAEETGIVWSTGLELWRRERRPGAEGRTTNDYHLWTGCADLTNADIVLGEGRQIVFVSPADVLRLDLGGSAAVFVPQFLRSTAYRRLLETKHWSQYRTFDRLLP